MIGLRDAQLAKAREFGVHRSICRPRVCAARVPKEVEERCCDTKAEIDLIMQRLKQAVSLSKSKE